MIISGGNGMTLHEVTRMIEENNAHMQNVTGMLNNLLTDNKASLVNAINDLYKLAADFKTGMADAIKTAGGCGGKPCICTFAGFH